MLIRSSRSINVLLCLWPADVLRFDNTYSIFQAKRVSFTVEVLLPDHMQSPQTNGGSSSHVQAEGNSQS